MPQGTYFVTTDVSSLGHADGMAFCAAMAERAKVVAIPNQVFYEDGSEDGRHLIRWAFCKEQDLIVEGHPPAAGGRPATTDHQTGGLPPGEWSAGGAGRLASGRTGCPTTASRPGQRVARETIRAVTREVTPTVGRRRTLPRVLSALLEPGARAGGEQPDDREHAGEHVQQADREGEEPDHERRGGAGREQVARPVVPAPGEPRQHAGTE